MMLDPGTFVMTNREIRDGDEEDEAPVIYGKGVLLRIETTWPDRYTTINGEGKETIIYPEEITLVPNQAEAEGLFVAHLRTRRELVKYANEVKEQLGL
jgi:hypothetical protein